MQALNSSTQKIPVLFNNTPSFFISDTPEEDAIGAYMRGAWAAFAKDPVNGLVSYGWPRYSTEDSTLVCLAYDNQTGPNLAIGNKYDGKCAGVPVVVSPTTTPSSTSAPTSSATPSPSAVPNLGRRSLPQLDMFFGLLLAVIVCLVG
jgi:hypothetical protein